MSFVEQRAVENFGLSSGVNKNSRFSRVNIITALAGVTTDCKNACFARESLLDQH